MRTLACAVAAAALTLGAPAAAFAHQGNPNYRSVITRVAPPAAGVRLSVLNYDDRLLLQNAGRADVMVLDYQQKPYIHAAADGTVAVNTNSEAYYLNEDRLGQAPVPKGLGPQPAWKVVSRNGRYDWHDHRIHWMGTGDPPQAEGQGRADEDRRLDRPAARQRPGGHDQRHPDVGPEAEPAAPARRDLRVRGAVDRRSRCSSS